jgi:response regulator RpfG family c-di-GMP phosphodiesterase
MRIKVLLLGDDPLSVVSDAQLLRDRGLLVYTAFNLLNIEDLIKEIKPDVIFFDPHKPNIQITDVYNNLVNGIYYTSIPVIFTLSEDDVYLVTRKRTASKDRRTIIADNVIDAIKMALRSNKTYHKKEKEKNYKVNAKIDFPIANARA